MPLREATQFRCSIYGPQVLAIKPFILLSLLRGYALEARSYASDSTHSNSNTLLVLENYNNFACTQLNAIELEKIYS